MAKPVPVTGCAGNGRAGSRRWHGVKSCLRHERTENLLDLPMNQYGKAEFPQPGLLPPAKRKLFSSPTSRQEQTFCRKPAETTSATEKPGLGLGFGLQTRSDWQAALQG